MERVSPTAQQRCNHQSNLFHEGWTDCRSEDETSLSPRSIKKRTLSQPSALDEKASDASPIQSRKLPPIQSAAPQDVPQRAPSLHSMPSPPSSTLPKTCLSRPFGVENILNPIAGNKTSSSGRQYDGDRTDFLRAAHMAAMPRPPTPSLPPISKKRDSPALMETYPPLLSPSLASGSHTSCEPGLITAGPSTATIDTRKTPFVLPQVASTGDPQSFFPTSSTFSEKGFNAPTSEASGQSQHQMLVFGTEHSPIQIPVDVQAASKVADEKRRRNATACRRFRQRRKEQTNISRLEAEVKYYQLGNRIPIPPRAASSRRSYTPLEGSQYQDTAASARNEGRDNRRRTNAYVPPQWLPPQTVEAPRSYHDDPCIITGGEP